MGACYSELNQLQEHNPIARRNIFLSKAPTDTLDYDMSPFIKLINKFIIIHLLTRGRNSSGEKGLFNQISN